jgi:hypothetical protein
MLAFAPVTYFREEQRLRDSWFWLIFFILPVIVVPSLLLAAPARALPAIAIVLGIAVLVSLLVWFARLETTVTSDAVVVAFHDVWPTRRIKLDDIESFRPKEYTIWDSGGWGVHLGFAGMTYNVSGNEGMHFQLRDGRRVLIGTQRLGQFGAALDRAMAARRTA